MLVCVSVVRARARVTASAPRARACACVCQTRGFLARRDQRKSRTRKLVLSHTSHTHCKRVMLGASATRAHFNKVLQISSVRMSATDKSIAMPSSRMRSMLSSYALEERSTAADLSGLPDRHSCWAQRPTLFATELHRQQHADALLCPWVGRTGRHRRTQTAHREPTQTDCVRSCKSGHPMRCGCLYLNAFTHAKQCGVIEHTHTHTDTPTLNWSPSVCQCNKPSQYTKGWLFSCALSVLWRLHCGRR